MLHALIMAGGGGTRFWPRSRSARPKQFLTLTGDRSLLQLACDRLESQVPPENTWIITAEQHRSEAQKQLPQLPPSQIVGEPTGRDTAPCIGLGAALIERRDSEAVMLVTPADHVIEPTAEFQRAVRAAVQTAQGPPEPLVTFGISPTYPATGYGYIHRRGPEIARRSGVAEYIVESFREKPAAELAEQFVASGEYFWNSGIFVWKATSLMAELHSQKPVLAKGVERIVDAWETPDRDAVLKQVYPTLEKVSIDYAVMEHASEVRVLHAPYKWDDVGSWLALERMHPQDAENNTVLATHVGIDTSHCVIVGDDIRRLIATIGVHDLLIIQDGDAVLIADRHDEGAVKRLVDRMKENGLDRYL
jgi:mannose-1-phosphate guanylyltransferase